jgi:hypothetical protein
MAEVEGYVAVEPHIHRLEILVRLLEISHHLYRTHCDCYERYMIAMLIPVLTVTLTSNPNPNPTLTPRPQPLTLTSDPGRTFLSTSSVMVWIFADCLVLDIWASSSMQSTLV